MTRNSVSTAALAAALLMSANPVNAGPYSDDLGKCLVASTSEQDKAQLVEWIFFSIALNPKISPYAQIAPDQREATDKKLAGLFERLLAQACAAQAKQAVRYEGTAALTESFKLLGQVAAQEIFSDPAVSAGTARFTRHLDEVKLQEALGLPKSGD